MNECAASGMLHLTFYNMRARISLHAFSKERSRRYSFVHG